jgi:hypothetical protein
MATKKLMNEIENAGNMRVRLSQRQFKMQESFGMIASSLINKKPRGHRTAQLGNRTI